MMFAWYSTEYVGGTALFPKQDLSMDAAIQQYETSNLFLYSYTGGLASSQQLLVAIYHLLPGKFFLGHQQIFVHTTITISAAHILVEQDLHVHSLYNECTALVPYVYTTVLVIQYTTSQGCTHISVSWKKYNRLKLAARSSCPASFTSHPLLRQFELQCMYRGNRW